MTSPELMSGPRASHARLASLVLALVGIALRLRQYAFHRSLWNDEASLAINIINRGYLGLTKPLSVEQGAPIGFLWLEKSATLLLGHSEYALRLVPLLVGIGSILVFRGITDRWLRPVASWLAISLFSVSPSLVYYASEAKQYGVDAGVGVFLLWFLSWLLDGGATLRKCVIWGGVAGVLVWCSFPAAFVAGAVSLVVFVVSAYRRAIRDVVHIVAGTALWLASFFVEYWTSLRGLHANPKLLGYWAFGFPARPLTTHRLWSWFSGDVHTIFGFPLHLGDFQLAAGLFIVGLLVSIWRQSVLASVIILTLAATMVAAVLHEYPMADRMILFLVPMVCLVLAACTQLWRRLSLQLGTAVLVVVVSAGQFVSAGSAVAHPYTRTEVREAYVFEQQHRQKGDAVFFEWEGEPDYLYYHQTLGVQAQGSIRLSGSEMSCHNADALFEFDQWKRVWLIFGIDPDTEAGHPIAHYLAAFRGAARVSLVHYSEGPSAAVLLTMNPLSRQSPSTVPGPPWQPAPYGCLSVAVDNYDSALRLISQNVP